MRKRYSARQKKLETRTVKPKIKEIPPEDRTIKDYSRKFFEIMKSVGPDKFVDGIFLVDKFESLGWHLKSGATTLWRVWRQVEGDFGERIQFIPQNSTHWMSKPSGWRYLDIPVEDGFPRRKKKRRIK